MTGTADWDGRALALLRLLPGRWFVLLDEDFTMRWVSEGVRRGLGFAPDELVDRPGFGLVHPDDLPLATSELVRMHDEAELDLMTFTLDTDHPATIRLRTADGSWAWVEMRGFNLLAVPGVEAVGVLCRRVNARPALEAVVDAIGSGAPLAEVLAVVESFASVPNSEDLVRLVRFVPGGVLACDGTPVGDDPLVSQVVDQARSATDIGGAELRGSETYGFCWITPVVPTGGDASVGALLCFTPRGGSRPGIGAITAFTTAARLAALAFTVSGEAERLRNEAAADPLTGVANRRRLQEVSAALHGPATVIALDLDRFKPVNDRWGHAAGDEVLVQVAQRLRACVRHGDVVGRVGGDEFAVLCPGLEEESVTRRLKARLRAAVRRPIALSNGEVVSVGVSLGTALRRDGETLEATFARADRSLVRVKSRRER